MAKTAKAKPEIRSVESDAPIEAPVAVDAGTCGRIEAMNDYAARVRAMQGSDMQPHESRVRIIAALEGQGYTDFDGLVIPA